jgi:hypothetical protein
MSIIAEEFKIKGEVSCRIEYKNGKYIDWNFPNTILRAGREAIVGMLTNTLAVCPPASGSYYNNSSATYVNRMVFGNGGTSGGVPKVVSQDRNSLFCGSPLVTKYINGIVDPGLSTQAIFTSVLLYDDPVASSGAALLNEMGLVMNNEDYYSMVTFPDLNKTSAMQITFNWRISML